MGLLAASALLAGGCSSSESTDAAETTATTSPAAPGTSQNLLVQNAADATFSDIEQSDGSTTATLTLTGVDAEAISFSERPRRWAASVDVASSVDAATARSDAGPPNAAVVWREDGEDRTVIVELTEPRWDAPSSTLVYRVRLIEGSGQLADFADGSTVDSLPSAPVGPVGVFIDGVQVGQQCNVTFYNDTGVHYVLSEGSTVWAAYAGPIPTDPPLTSVLPIAPQTYSPWIDDAYPSFSGCFGDIYLVPEQGEDGAGYHYHFEDPTLGSNTTSCSTASGYACRIDLQSNHDLLAAVVTICIGDSCEPPPPATTTTTEATS